MLNNISGFVRVNRKPVLGSMLFITYVKLWTVKRKLRKISIWIIDAELPSNRFPSEILVQNLHKRWCQIALSVAHGHAFVASPNASGWLQNGCRLLR